jgi:MYXO-CTERM domain-containing protein
MHTPDITRNSPPRLASAGLSLLAGFCCSQSVNADLYWMNDASQYGYLCQYSLPDSELAAESCIPTSTTNAMAYLQNMHGSELGKTPLTGLDYNSWMTTASELRGPGYMNTNSNNGTNAIGQTRGLQTYLSDIGAYPGNIRLEGTSTFSANKIEELYQDSLPSWMQTSQHPTMSIMHQWLSGGAGIVVDLLYNGGSLETLEGHAVTLVGLNWIDANNNGIVEQNEGATLSVIDPLNPTEGSNGPIAIGPPKITEISIWDSSEGMSFSYLQYHGDSIPYDENFESASGSLSGAGAIFVIPTPGAAGLLIAGLLASGRRRRTA